jgi:AraC-like DNA-binding protein
MFQQILDQIDFYEREYCPKWLYPYKFDNYFEIKNKKYVLEMDGGLGHGKKTYDHKIDVEGKERDCKKENIAKEHNITIIRVDASNDQKIQYNTYMALKEIVNLDDINWNKVVELSSKSLIKQVCEFYEENKNEMLLKDIASHFCISGNCINRYLKFGKKYGWCNYITSREMHKIRLKNTIDLKNKDKSLTQKEIATLLNYSLSSVKQYFKEAYSKNLIKK